jgi:hypothetical protein
MLRELIYAIKSSLVSIIWHRAGSYVLVQPLEPVLGDEFVEIIRCRGLQLRSFPWGVSMAVGK